MTYPGGKGSAGAYQRIINHMPPHRVYIEACLGSGAVLRKKRAAEVNIGIDRSADAIKLCRRLGGARADKARYLEGDALKLLPSLKSTGCDRHYIEQPDTLIYVDPPYMKHTRKGGDLYDFEMTDADHAMLLSILTEARSMVMISGYRSDLYDVALQGFTRIDYLTNTRRGMVPECLWMNFPLPAQLHDYSHLGENFRERERIKRKAGRWANKIKQLDRLEQLAIMDALLAETNPRSQGDAQ